MSQIYIRYIKPLYFPSSVFRSLFSVFRLLLLAAMFFSFPACSNNKDGATNPFLSEVHSGYHDCTQTGCHTGFSAAGTVFNDYEGMSPKAGVRINLKRVKDGKIISLPASLTKGIFYSESPLSGSFLVYAGEVNAVRPSTSVHLFPQWKGCNRCHVPGGSTFGGYPKALGTIKWKPV